MKNLSRYLMFLAFIFIITGCANKNLANNEQMITPSTSSELSNLVDSLAYQLEDNFTLKKSQKESIAITSFVDLNQLDRTTPFGRVVSEMLFNELFIRDFCVIDFRGQDAITINNDGEFYITRDISKIQDEIVNRYILVGTYSMIEDMVTINARIIDNETGLIVATAKESYKNQNCELFDTCMKKSMKNQRKIKLIGN